MRNVLGKALYRLFSRRRAAGRNVLLQSRLLKESDVPGRESELDPSPERKRELKLRLSTLSENGPFRGKQLSRADVTWLLALQREGEEQIKIVKYQGTQQQVSCLDLRGADLCEVDLRRVSFAGVNFTGAFLQRAHLEECVLSGAVLEGADLREAHLEGAVLSRARLGGANLQGAYFDPSTTLANTLLYDERDQIAALADIRWGGVNLATIAWEKTTLLGDEQAIGHQQHAGAYRTALRAYRQLASALREQGLLEEADAFAYQAQALKYPLRAWSLIEKLRRSPASRFSLRIALRLRRFLRTKRGLAAAIGYFFVLFLLTSLAVQNSLPTFVQVGGFLLLLPFFIFGLGVLSLPILLQVAITLCVQIVIFTILQIGCLYALSQVFGPLISQLLGLPLLSPLEQVIIISLFIPFFAVGFLLLNQLILRRSSLVTRVLVPAGKAISSFYRYNGSLFQDFFITILGCISLAFVRFLGSVSGFGYKPERCVLWYLLILLSYALLYMIAGQPHSLDTFFLSVTAFHGRGFFPSTFPRPNEFLVALAATEAIIGLFLELSFIASFTQRFYGK